MGINVPPPSMADADIASGAESRHLFSQDGDDGFLTLAKTWAGNNRSIEDLRYLVLDLEGARLSKVRENVNAASAILTEDVRYEDIHNAIFENGMLRYIDSGVMALTQAYGLKAIKDGKLDPRRPCRQRGYACDPASHPPQAVRREDQVRLGRCTSGCLRGRLCHQQNR